MTPEQLNEIEARAKAASPGPWRCGGDIQCGGDGCVHCWHTFTEQAEVYPPIGEFGPVATAAQGEHRNAQFIAAARQDIPQLTTALRSAWAERDRLREMLDDARSMPGLLLYTHEKG